jgi:cyclophilin family peptidyl-prolyl cis-trans isomerase
MKIAAERSGLRLAAAALLLLACEGEGEREAGDATRPTLAVPSAASPRDVAVLDVEGMGEIRIELLSDLAPATAAHFAALAERDHYDGTTFHRVIPGFMVQGGDPNSRDRDPRNDGHGGQQERVADERPELSQLRGMVSLANRGVPNSSGSQFFILVSDSQHLDGRYAAFGRVTEGMDVVDRIVAVERDLYGRFGPIDRPVQDVVIRDVRIERAAQRAEATRVP